jgi:hypothetical protein
MNTLVNFSIENKLHSPFTPLFFVLYLALCSFVIILALTSAWKISLVVVFLSFFLITAYKNQWNIFLLISICIISFIELSLGIRLGSTAGMSLMNVALGLGLLLLMIKNLKTEKRFFQQSFFNWPLLILGLYKFTSLFFTYLRGEYADKFPVLLTYLKNEIDPFLIFLVAFNLLDSEEDIKKIVYFLLGFSIFIIFMNVLNYYIGIDFLSFADVGWGVKEISSGPYQPGFRLTGLFKDPNLFASLLILFSSLTITTIFYTNQVYLKLIFTVCLFFQIFALVLTGSRGGYVGFFGLVLILFFVAMKKKFIKFKQVIFYAGLLLLLIAAVFALYRVPFMTNVFGRLQSENVHNVITVTSRLELWKTGIIGFFQAPLFGHGWKNFVDVHNSYIFYLVTLGVVGFSLYMLIYFNFLIICWRGLKNDRFDTKNYINFSFIAGFGGILLVMNFIGIFYVYHYLFFYAGIVMKYNTLNNARLNNIKRKGVKKR